MKRFQASETERGCVLDFVDYPLNNRWWLEDEFNKIRAMSSEPEKVARLEALAHWEHPGPGSYYDDIGDIAKSPHVVRGPELNTDPAIPLAGTSFPGFVWDQGGYSRLRLSWQGSMRPAQMVYENVDPEGQYTIRLNGAGASRLYINRTKVEPIPDSKTAEPPVQDQPALQAPRPKFTPHFTDFDIPQELLKDRRIIVDWNDPSEPPTPRLRFGSPATEIWLLKKQ